MDSLHRIFLAVRAYVREFSLMTYFLGPLFLIGFTGFSFLVSSDSNNEGGEILAEYFSFAAEGVVALLTCVIALAATIISIEFIRNELQTEERASRLLALPLSPAERFLSLLIMVWFVVPVIVITPILLLGSMAGWLAPDQLLLPAPGYFITLTISAGWIAYASISLLWLAPVMGYARRAWFIFIIVVFGLSTYIITTRNNTPHTIHFEHPLTELRDTSVVGLAKLSVLTDDTPRTQVYYGVDNPVDPSTWSTLVLAFFLVAAAYFALTHQKS